MPRQNTRQMSGNESASVSPRRSGALFWRRWHRRGMVVDDHPTVTVLDVGEAVSCGQALRLTILDIGKSVVAGIDRRIAIHAYQLIAEGDLEPGQNLERGHEIVSERRPV